METKKGLSQMYFLCFFKGVKLGQEMGRKRPESAKEGSCTP